MISWDLIERSNFFGGYGFGFVEAYFRHLNVMGVGLGSGSINNIILDMWLQGSIIAVIYLLGLFYISFCNRSYFTILIPVFFFVFGITNPIISEEFYLFLGISYSFCRYSNFLQKEGASAMVWTCSVFLTNIYFLVDQKGKIWIKIFYTDFFYKYN